MVVRDGPPDRFPFRGPQDAGMLDLIGGFKQKMVSAGINVPPAEPKVFFTEPLPGPNADPGRRRALALIKNALAKNLDRSKKPSFVLVFLALEDNYIYPGVKKIGDVDMGVNTVCMLLLPKKALIEDRKKRDQYYSNVALKASS
jgi:eukaryotic translation initiation factor 2C